MRLRADRRECDQRVFAMTGAFLAFSVNPSWLHGGFDRWFCSLYRHQFAVPLMTSRSVFTRVHSPDGLRDKSASVKCEICPADVFTLNNDMFATILSDIVTCFPLTLLYRSYLPFERRWYSMCKRLSSMRCLMKMRRSHIGRRDNHFPRDREYRVALAAF
jgi:hypothetical protein